MSSTQPPPLEPNFEEGRTYGVTGALLNRIIRAIRDMMVIPGKGLEWRGTRNGRVLDVTVKAGGGGTLGELALSLDRPDCFSPPTSGPSTGSTRVWVNLGFFNDSEPRNSVWYFDVASTRDSYFFAVATLIQDAPRVEISRWELAVGTNKGAHKTDPWPADGNIPRTFALCLGKYSESTGKVSSGNGGSIWLSAPIGNISQSDHITFDRYFEVNRNGTRYALNADQAI